MFKTKKIWQNFNKFVEKFEDFQNLKSTFRLLVIFLNLFTLL